ncbi:MAG: diguanylate cyclase, partial [Burkholderiaceae bacterium]|nr:diguanylate cyclase [Burkholderiaceae bacterium]
MAVPYDIAHWRAQVFSRLLLVVLVLGALTAIPSVTLAIGERMWSIVATDVAALVWLTVIWRWRSLPYTFRVLNFLAIAFMVGVALLLKVGPVSQIYLMAIPVLAALLLGLRPALATLVLAGLVVMVLGYDANSKLQIEGIPNHALLKAAIISINFMFMTAVLTLSCAVLLRHLARSFEQLQERQNELSALNAELSLTAVAVSRLNDMVLIAEVDTPGDASEATQHIIFVNEAFERRNGYRRHEVLGRSLRLLRGPETEVAVLAKINEAMAHNEAVRAELLNYTKSGEAYWVETDLVPFTDKAGVNTHWVAVERDITERKKSQDDIHQLAYYDVLTGLPNRRMLMDNLEQLLASSRRGGTFSAVMFIDLDRFKTINDARGHTIGDAVLRNASERLRALMRKADTVARIGGDEFVVLLGHLAHDLTVATHAALTVAEKVRLALGEELDIEGQIYNSTASIGVTMLPRTGKTAHDLLREADTAMYRAKAAGRNGVAFFEAAMQADVERRLNIEHELNAALNAGALQMYVQAQV